MEISEVKFLFFFHCKKTCGNYFGKAFCYAIENFFGNFIENPSVVSLCLFVIFIFIPPKSVWLQNSYETHKQVLQEFLRQLFISFYWIVLQFFFSFFFRKFHRNLLRKFNKKKSIRQLVGNFQGSYCKWRSIETPAITHWGWD